jgi:hypothetical protein
MPEFITPVQSNTQTSMKNNTSTHNPSSTVIYTNGSGIEALSSIFGSTFISLICCLICPGIIGTIFGGILFGPQYYPPQYYGPQLYGPQFY